MCRVSEPLVSIVLPTYNREALLPRAIESVMAQTYERWELLLVDDGSTDGTPALANRYRQMLGHRFHSLQQEHAGSSAARNHGIDRARGTFIAFLDSDDAFLPSKLARQVELFARQPELGLVYSDYSYVDLSGTYFASAFDTKCAGARTVPRERIETNLCVCGHGLFDCLLENYFIATITGMVRRELLERGIRFTPEISYGEEWLFYLKVARMCRGGFVDEPLAVHYFTPNSLARSDKHDNMIRFRKLLQAMEKSFPHLASGQRRSIRRRRAQAAVQLGYEARRAGRRFQALAWLAESFRYRPTLAILRAIGAALVSSNRARSTSGKELTTGRPVGPVWS